MCGTHNEGKSVVAKKLIRNLKEKNLRVHDFGIEKCVYW